MNILNKPLTPYTTTNPVTIRRILTKCLGKRVYFWSSNHSMYVCGKLSVSTVTGVLFQITSHYKDTVLCCATLQSHINYKLDIAKRPDSIHINIHEV